MPAIQRLTDGPQHHWFGYYDKWQFDPSDRYGLGMAVDFEHRSPRADDVIQLGLIDLQANNRWTSFAETRAWGWQQGCMLQWRPQSDSQIIWNDRQNNHFVSYIYNMKTGHIQDLPRPVYTLSPNGQTALGTDFRRINDMRPGYGYAGLPDPNRNSLAPDNSGIYRLDLNSGQVNELISIAQVAHIPHPRADIRPAKHYFNHLLFNPSGSRFIFLHRWRFGDGPFHTRMLTAASDGSDIRVIDDYGHMSHFIWRDERHILAWTKQPSHGFAFYILEDGSDRADPIGLEAMTQNGHCTYLPQGDWILNDSYPYQSDQREQALYLYHVPSQKRIDLGRFPAPPAYTGEWRCDLHPRSNRKGTQVIIDSAHEGLGRQMYLVDISSFINKLD